MRTLGHQKVLELHTAIVAARPASSRVDLLVGLDPRSSPASLELASISSPVTGT